VVGLLTILFLVVVALLRGLRVRMLRVRMLCVVRLLRVREGYSGEARRVKEVRGLEDDNDDVT